MKIARDRSNDYVVAGTQGLGGEAGIVGFGIDAGVACEVGADVGPGRDQLWLS